MKIELIAKFDGLCPNCGGPIYNDRLSEGLPCRACLPRIPDEYERNLNDKKIIFDQLKKENKLINFDKNVVFKIAQIDESIRFFKKVTNREPWSIQRTWIKRLLKGYSFSIVAPTGVGKTFFGSVMSLYLAKNNKMCYILLPTIPLVDQVSELLNSFIAKCDDLKNIRIITYHSNLSKRVKNENSEQIKQGNFDILITTTHYLATNFEILKQLKFDFVFVDDVDAILKTSKNILRVLMLIGFDKEIIQNAMKLIDAKIKRAKLLSKRNKNNAEISSIEKMIETLKSKIKLWKNNHHIGQIIVSSATSRPRGKRVYLFKELLGFQIGGISEGIRKIHDFFLIAKEHEYDTILINVLKSYFYDGGLIFIPRDKGISEAERIAKLLRLSGFKAEAYHAEKKESLLKAFRDKELKILVGVAAPQGLLVRGIDMPERVKFAIFLDLPRYIVPLKSDRIPPTLLLHVMKIIGEATGNKEIKEIMQKLVNKIRSIDTNALRLLKNAIISDEPVTGFIEKLKVEFINAAQYCISLLHDSIVQKQLEEYPYAKIICESDGFTIILPDVDTYIQASGRTSRLFPGGVTTGLSVIITQHQNLINGLKRQLGWRYENVNMIQFNDDEIKTLVNEIENERILVAKILAGDLPGEFKDPIKSAVLIVESPNKARTIANFFGKPAVRDFKSMKVYEVSTGDLLLNIVATKGHIFDLVNTVGLHGVEKENNSFIPVYSTIKRCLACGKQFVEGNKCPRCGNDNLTDALDLVRRLMDLITEFDICFLGLDPDVEGEKIAWDVYNIISMGMNNNIKRMEFHEVSKTAISNGLHNPRNINTNLVKAQIVRRIEDRWVGYELSRVLWDKFNKKGLSAGRVQSAVLMWIIDRYHKWIDTLHYYYRLLFNNFSVIVDYPMDKNTTQAIEREKKLKSLELEVLTVEKIQKTIQPLPPYTTDTLLEDATSFLKIPASDVMKLAQTLFECGLITYHRTDSTRVSPQGLKVAKDYILDKYGNELYSPRKFGLGGAHECIRPVKPIDGDKLKDLIHDGIIKNPSLTRKHIMLYDLIFRRFIASQMPPSEIEYQIAKIKIDEKEVTYEGLIDFIKQGFAREYKLHLPKKVVALNKAQKLRVNDVIKWKSSPYKLYTQAEIIREMKEKSIGRPSTYAIIIQKLFERNYIIEDKGKIRPTQLGIQVEEFLRTYYRDLISETRTRALYEKMDMVELNKIDYQKVLHETYDEIVRKVSNAFITTNHNKSYSTD